METANPDSETERTEEGPDAPETIPFKMGECLKLRSIENPSLKAQTPIVGVNRKDIILIEEPKFKTDDRIAGRIGGSIICTYFSDGWIFKFKSRLGQILINDIVCIDYPKKFEARQLRANPRIMVFLEAVSAIGKEQSLIHGNIIDISQDGCCLELPSLISPAPGSPIEVTFMLPNNDMVENLKCIVRNMRQDSEGKRTFLGLSFTALNPSITNFCEMCSYFRV